MFTILITIYIDVVSCVCSFLLRRHILHFLISRRPANFIYFMRAWNRECPAKDWYVSWRTSSRLLDSFRILGSGISCLKGKYAYRLFVLCTTCRYLWLIKKVHVNIFFILKGSIVILEYQACRDGIAKNLCLTLVWYALFGVSHHIKSHMSGSNWFVVVQPEL